MPHPSKRPKPPSAESAFPPGSALEFLALRNQLDFEVEFFTRLLTNAPGFAEALRAQACNLTIQGRLQDGLTIDKQLVALRPTDPTAHYNLACRYSLLQEPDLALGSLRKAVELGYRDFAFIDEDRDLDAIRKDPRFRQLMREYRKK